MRTVQRGLLAGLAGSAAMMASTVVEMRLRRRPASTAPVTAFEHATGIRLRSDRVRRALSWGADIPFGMALALTRPLLGDGPAAPVAFFAIAWTPDLAVVPALDDVPPPWRWGATELAISGLHHAVYAAVTETAWRTLR